MYLKQVYVFITANNIACFSDLNLRKEDCHKNRKTCFPLFVFTLFVQLPFFWNVIVNTVFSTLLLNTWVSTKKVKKNEEKKLFYKLLPLFKIRSVIFIVLETVHSSLRYVKFIYRSKLAVFCCVNFLLISCYQAY